MSDNKQYLLKAGLGVAAIALIWYLSSASSPRKNSPEVQVLKEFCEKMYPHLMKLSKRCEAFLASDDRITPELLYSKFGETLSGFEAQVMNEIGRPGEAIEDIANNVDADELEKFQNEFSRMVQAAVSGVPVPKAYYEIHPNFSNKEHIEVFKAVDNSHAVVLEKYISENEIPILKINGTYKPALTEDIQTAIEALREAARDEVVRSHKFAEWYPLGGESFMDINNIVMMSITPESDEGIALTLFTQKHAKEMQAMLAKYYKESNDSREDLLAFFKSFCEVAHPEFVKLSTVCAALKQVVPGYNYQTGLQMFQGELQQIEQKMVASLGKKGFSLSYLLRDYDADEEFAEIQEVYQVMIIGALSGLKIIPPFFKLPEDFDTEKFMAMYDEFKMDKAENFRKVFEELGHRAGKIDSKDEQDGFALTKKGSKRLAELNVDVEEKHLKNGPCASWFPNGIESLEDVVLKAAREIDEFAVKIQSVTEKQGEKIKAIMAELKGTYYPGTEIEDEEEEEKTQDEAAAVEEPKVEEAAEEAVVVEASTEQTPVEEAVIVEESEEKSKEIEASEESKDVEIVEEKSEIA
eukprot:GDKJ01036331.1.p1 GENE.GDKJ01036331.1~~GDKJ01036331.1.p1  ORF type:complete len:580 (+),score=205.03 GDKJ01036331.1:37-1776(+)